MNQLEADQSVVVGHPYRHHLYNTALAYSEVNRLAGFYTNRFFHRPALLQGISHMPVANKWAHKALGYHHPKLCRHTHVLVPNSAQKSAALLLGSRSLITTDQSVGEYAGRLCVEMGHAIHLPTTSAVEGFRLCSQAGLPCILEQYIGYRPAARRLVEMEVERWGLSDQVDSVLSVEGLQISREELNEEELNLATTMIVGSDFVKDTLTEAGFANARIKTCPYGVNESVVPKTLSIARRRPDEPLRVIFVGHVGLRKGTLYLLEAAKSLGPSVVQITCYGMVQLPDRLFRPYQDVLALAGHVTRKELREAFARSHVFALPSLFEGSSLAVYEAMANGLPVVVTPNTGSVARDSKEGFIVPIQNSEQIAQSLLRFYEDEQLRTSMAHSAAHWVKQFTWSNYRRKVREALGIEADALQIRRGPATK